MSALFKSALAQAELLNRRQISAVELMQDTLARIKTINPQVNAIISLREEADLLVQAAQADKSSRTGWMHGLPIAIKDLHDVKDMPSSMGSAIFADYIAEKDDIAVAVKRELNEAMSTYGYDIINTLITDIDPDIQVKNAMNRINAADREKTAAEYEAEAGRIRIVAKAKAEAESKRLQGQGIADQRREIARGLEESVVVLNRAGINSQEASALIVITQHYDTLQSIGSDTKSNLILLPNNPNAASSMLNDMVTSLVAANKVQESSHEDENKKSKK